MQADSSLHGATMLKNLAITAMRIFCLLRGQLCHFSFIYLWKMTTRCWRCITKKKSLLIAHGTSCTRTSRDLLGLLYSQANRPPEIFHENLSLFHFCWIHFRPYHRAKWHLHTQIEQHQCCSRTCSTTRIIDWRSPRSCEPYLWSKLVGDAEGKGSFACAWCTGEEKRTASHLLRSNQIYHDATCLQQEGRISQRSAFAEKNIAIEWR